MTAARASAPTLRELGTYNYFRRNVAGVQREWWYHRSGCRAWFIAERDTRTNEVLLDGAARGTAAGARREPSPRAARRAHRPLDRVVGFTFDGKRVEALEGDTIASALYAAGRRTFSRSFKYHRRRGLLCCAGQCPNCLVAVDGAPGVRACTEPVREGMARRAPQRLPQPRARRDARDRRGRRPVHPAGLLLQDLHPPAAAVAAVREGAAPRRRSGQAARGAGRARVAHRVPPPPRRRARRRRRRWPGCAPRSAAAEAGADVVLVDEGPEPGGRLLAEGGHERARDAGRAGARRGRRDPRLRLRRWASSTASSPSGRATPCTRSAPAGTSSRPATIEQPLVFAGNDLPGVMLSGGVRRLIALYGVAPGTRAVVATTSDRGLEAALALHARGRRGRRRRRPAATPGARPGARPAGSRLSRHTIIEARGSRRSAGRCSLDGGGRSARFDCDLLVVSGGAAPATLAARAGRRAAPPTTRRAGTSRSPSCPTACSPPARSPARARDARAAPARIAGLEAAHALGFGDARARRRAARRRRARGASARRWRCPPAGGRRRARQVLRVPVRGRDRPRTST